MLPNMLYADWASDFFDGMKQNSQLRGGSTIQTQGGTTFSGGGWTWEGSNATLKPFSVKAPSINAGCSGISIDFGAFSMIDEESLIAFLEALLQAAPGYAFELAMQVLCPSCLDIMNTLNQIANTLNGAQLDACGTLKNAGNMLDKAIFSATDGQLGTGSSNSFTQWMDTYIDEPLQTLNNVLDTLFSCTAGDKTCPIYFLKGKDSLQENIINEIMNSNPTFYNTIREMFGTNNGTEIAGILAAIVGDVVMIQSDGYTGKENIKGNSSSGEGNMSVVPVGVIKGDREYYRQVSNLFAYGKKETPSNALNAYEKYNFDIYVYSKTGKDNTFGPDFLKSDTKELMSYQGKAQQALKDIYAGFSDRRAGIDNSSVRFMGSFKTPVYKILNLYSINNTSLQHFISAFEQLAAGQMVYELVSGLSAAALPAISKFKQQVSAAGLLTEELESKIDIIVRNYNDFQVQAYKLYIERYDKFYKQMQDTNYLQDLQKMQRAMMARHPVVDQKIFAPSMGM